MTTNTISYTIFWVSPKNPKVVLDVYDDNIMDFKTAQASYFQACVTALSADDELDWIPRIMEYSGRFI